MIIEVVFSRPLTPSEIRKLELGKRIWDKWKLNFGVSSVLIKGGK